jgi:hypothetical protein
VEHIAWSTWQRVRVNCGPPSPCRSAKRRVATSFGEAKGQLKTRDVAYELSAVADATILRTMKFLQALSTAVLALTSLVNAASFSNPLKKTDGSDPHIVWTGGYFYLMTTTWTNLQITRAKTLEGLKTGEKKTVWTDTNTNR